MLTFSPASWRGVTPRAWQSQAFAAVVAHLGQPEPVPAVVSAIMGAGKTVFLAEVCACLRQAPGTVVVVSTSTEMLVEDLTDAIRKRLAGDKLLGQWYGRGKKLGDIIVTCIPSVPALALRLRQAGRRVCLWIADEVHRVECPTILEDYDNLSPEHAIGLTATPFRADKLEAISLFDKMLYRYGVSAAQGDGVVVPWEIVHDRAGGAQDETCLRMVADAQGPGLANASCIDDAEAFAFMLTEHGLPAMAIHSLLHPRERRNRIKELREGALRALVHVNMLAEGANYPWLRWLLLRRQVESRVRFIQEVGRLLRSHPGKAHATFYDPHDLFGGFHLAYAEALGEPPEKPEWEAPEQNLELAGQRIREEPDEAVALAWVESCIRTLVVAADSAGLTRGRRTIKKLDRLMPSTPIQVAAVAEAVGLAEPYTPQGWRGVFSAVLSRPLLVRFGFAADLLAALAGITTEKRWPPVDAQGRISGIPGQESAPACPVIIGGNGQHEVDWDRVEIAHGSV